jgi:2-dehydropantoate 2-reductase
MTSALVFGAGAVGQVFGRHLALGGAEVTFFVREKYRDSVAHGFDMYALNGPRSTDPARFDRFRIVSAFDELRAQTFDQVYLTVASPSVREPWVKDLVSATKDATIVALQPGGDDREAIVAAGVTEDRLISGLISFISYAAPLRGETRFTRPGTAYWFPPVAPSRFSGPPDRLRRVIEALDRGGLPAKRHRDIPHLVSFPTAILMAYLVALEAAGWSLATFSKGALSARGAEAARESIAIVATTSGRPPIGARLITHRPLLRAALWFGARLVPFPLEAYLEKHFTKVGAQTQLLVASTIARGRAEGLPVRALEALVGTLDAGQAATRSIRGKDA